MRFLALILLVAAAAPAQQHGYSPADIEQGARLYAANCIACHGAEGDGIPGVNLRRGQFRRATSDEDLIGLITTGVPGTPMPPGNFNTGEMLGLVAYLRSLRDGPARSIAPGEPARGRRIFEGKGGCLKCHRVDGNGSRLGPDLSEVGAIRPPAYLERSLVDPGESLLPQHRFIRAVTRSGEVVTGRRLNEDTHVLLLIDSNDRLLSLAKADLREFAPLKTSPMPPYRGKLTPAEIADVVAFLASLKGLNP